MRVFIKNFGCKTNFYDAFSIIGRLRKVKDIELSGFDDSEIVILNSCSVTQDAEREVLKWIKKAKREGKKVFVTGCLPNLKTIEADFIAGAGNYDNITKIFDEKISEPEHKLTKNGSKNKLEIHQEVIERDLDECAFDLFPRSRAYIKVQEGCSRFCTFCSIPLTRGLPRYVSPEKVIAKMKELAEKGFKEFVIVGTHLALYGQNGREAGDITLGKLVKIMAKEFSREKIKIRFSSLSPKEIDSDMLEAFEEAKEIFCPHFHISVQSGSNRILKLMRRWHTYEDFLEDAEKLLKIFPDACIGTDIIVGFPGEREEDFEITIENLKKSPLGHIHVFPFSPRPKTPAFFMKKVPEKEVRTRMEIALKVAEEKRTEFFRKFIGRELEVLVENKNNGMIAGTSTNYISVVARAERDIQKGDFVLCEIQSVEKGGNRIYATGKIV